MCADDVLPAGVLAFFEALGPLPGGWANRAACRGLPTGWFFPDRGEPVADAQAVCATCPVAGDCLAWAVAVPEKMGIWGGTTGRTRRKARMARMRGEAA